MFVKCLEFCDVGDAFQHPLRYVHRFLLLTLLSKDISLYNLQHRVQSCCTTQPPLNEGLALSVVYRRTSSTTVYPKAAKRSIHCAPLLLAAELLVYN